MVSTECYPQDYVNGYFQVDGWDFAQPRRLPQCGYRFDDFVNYHFIYYKFKNFTYYILSLTAYQNIDKGMCRLLIKN